MDAEEEFECLVANGEDACGDGFDAGGEEFGEGEAVEGVEGGGGRGEGREGCGGGEGEGPAAGEVGGGGAGCEGDGVCGEGIGGEGERAVCWCCGNMCEEEREEEDEEWEVHLLFSQQYIYSLVRYKIDHERGSCAFGNPLVVIGRWDCSLYIFWGDKTSKHLFLPTI